MFLLMLMIRRNNGCDRPFDGQREDIRMLWFSFIYLCLLCSLVVVVLLSCWRGVWTEKIQRSESFTSKQWGREISNEGRYSSQSYHHIMSLQCLYVLKGSEEKYARQTHKSIQIYTSRFKFTQYKEWRFPLTQKYQKSRIKYPFSLLPPFQHRFRCHFSSWRPIVLLPLMLRQLSTPTAMQQHSFERSNVN